MELTWLQGAREADLEDVRGVAEDLRLDTEAVRAQLTAIAPVGGTSHQVDEVVHPHAMAVGFSSQRLDLFSDYPVALRPDWYRPDYGGILLEVERGKTLTNNMDLLDLWKCHICRHASHLFLIVPMLVRRSRSIEHVYPRVVSRLQTFFDPGNETNVRSVGVFGYA